MNQLRGDRDRPTPEPTLSPVAVGGERPAAHPLRVFQGGAPATGCESSLAGQLGETPLRRLTKFEYANTIRDLLKVDAAPVADMPVDEVTDGFNNNSGVLTVSPLHA